MNDSLKPACHSLNQFYRSSNHLFQTSLFQDGDFFLIQTFSIRTGIRQVPDAGTIGNRTDNQCVLRKRLSQRRLQNIVMLSVVCQPDGIADSPSCYRIGISFPLGKRGNANQSTRCPLDHRSCIASLIGRSGGDRVRFHCSPVNQIFFQLWNKAVTNFGRLCSCDFTGMPCRYLIGTSTVRDSHMLTAFVRFPDSG